MLLNFQRNNLIESSSSSGDSDSNNLLDQMRLMEDKNPMMRLVIFGKMKKMMNKYNNKITDLDKRLLRGLFEKKTRDFDDELREKTSSQTLLSRLVTDRELILDEADMGGE